MAMNLTIVNDNQELATLLSGSKETGIEVVRTEDGVVAVPPVESNTWIPVLVKEEFGELVLMVAETEQKSLAKRLLENEEQELNWKFSKDRLISLCDIDDQAIFKVVALLDQFGGNQLDAEVFIHVLEYLSKMYSIEWIFEMLLAVKSKKFFKILEAARESDELLLQVFQEEFVR